MCCKRVFRIRKLLSLPMPGCTCTKPRQIIWKLELEYHTDLPLCLILLRYTPGGVKHVALGEYANIQVGKEKVVQIDDGIFYHVYVNNPGIQSQWFFSVLKIMVVRYG